ncbi:MAG TPA: MBL fold metallo-hydrolase [bacterium]|nr:MBL fold metallo-hydrolase [bacterium]
MTASKPGPGEVWYQHVSDGTYALDGGAMFGVVPRNLWAQRKPPDDQNRIHLGLNCLLIRTPDRNILVDDGIGTKDSEKFRTIYKVMQPPTLPEDLGRYGLTADDITDVILTHLHFDHAGGSTRLDEQGEPVPTFPNAMYYVHPVNYEEALAAHERNRASYLSWNWKPMLNRGQLTVIGGNGQIIPGVPEITGFDSGGHARGHMVVEANFKGTPIVYLGDIIPTAAHMGLPWIMAYDLYPVETLEVKRANLKRWYDEGYLLFFEHETDFPWARIQQLGEDKYEAVPIPEDTIVCGEFETRLLEGRTERTTLAGSPSGA